MVRHRPQISKIVTILFLCQLMACNYQLDKESSEIDQGGLGEELPLEMLDFKTTQDQVFFPLCQNCHSRAGQFTFEDFETVFSKLPLIENRVFSQQNMPPSGRMPEPAKELLKQWIENGGPE